MSDFSEITIGEVVDANDPQQMGRLRVMCNALGDDANANLGSIPWAGATSPLGGITEHMERGRTGEKSSGPVAYGMWNVPKVGSQVLVACIDGDPRFRVWLGCIHTPFMAHTLPHGRFIADGTSSVVGPQTSTENVMEPSVTHLYKNFTPTEPSVIVPSAPSPDGDHTLAPEYLSRGADYSVSSVRDEFVGSEAAGPVTAGDDNADDILTEVDGTTTSHANGYKESRLVKNIGFVETDGKNYDSQVYSWTTPGFHAVSMDDSANNCRVRLRTTHGNQIILDDTNERIYISTPDGNTWFEMDEKGNIDVFASRNISFHAKKDINFTAGETIRLNAVDGIHVESDDEIRIHSKGIDGGDFSIRSDTNIRQYSVLNTYVESEVAIHIKSLDAIMVQTGTVLNITAASSVAVSTPETSFSAAVKVGATMDVVGATTTANIVANTSSIAAPPGSGDHSGQVKLGSGGTPATPTAAIVADPADELQAFFTNRVPEHEPWARVMTKPEITDMDIDNTHEASAEFPYNSPMVNRTERGFDLSRNDNWHR